MLTAFVVLTSAGLVGYAFRAALAAERERTQKSASPFGCGDIYQALEQHSYQGFPWMKPVRPSAESGIIRPSAARTKTRPRSSGDCRSTASACSCTLKARPLRVKSLT